VHPDHKGSNPTLINQSINVCDDFEGDKNSRKDEEGEKRDPEPAMSNTEAHDTAVNHTFTCTALAGITDRTFQT
jgi:hypothetical protein